MLMGVPYVVEFTNFYEMDLKNTVLILGKLYMWLEMKFLLRVSYVQ